RCSGRSRRRGGSGSFEAPPARARSPCPGSSRSRSDRHQLSISRLPCNRTATVDVGVSVSEGPPHGYVSAGGHVRHCETSFVCGTSLLGLAFLGVTAAPALVVAVVAAGVHRRRRGAGFWRALLAWWAAGTSVTAGMACLVGAAYVLLVAGRSSF